MSFTKSTLLAAAFALITGTAGAAVIGELGILDDSANGGINPATGLAWAPGDTYRLIFLTQDATVATSSDIATYNAFVTAQANQAGGPGGTWNIIGSTLTVDARDNTGTNPSSAGVGIFLIDGVTKIADDNADLWDGSIDAAISLDQFGDAHADDRAFTGTLPGGTKVTGTGDQPLGNFGEGLGNIRTGRSLNTNGGWMTNFNTAHTNPNSVYAMSELLTVVPEPSSLALLGLGGLLIARRRRG